MGKKATRSGDLLTSMGIMGLLNETANGPQLW